MAAWMRSSVLIIICLMSLVFAGPISAACATDLGGWADSVTVSPGGAARADDCNMGQTDQSPSKAHKCSHDACCGYQLAAFPEDRDFSTPPPLRAATIASVTKPLKGSGWETLLDPPRT
jgi:hypothetical protein